MIAQIASSIYERNVATTGARGAERLISALFGPTQASVDNPGLEAYRERLQAMDAQCCGGKPAASPGRCMIPGSSPPTIRFSFASHWKTRRS